MASELGTGYINLVPSTKGFQAKASAGLAGTGAALGGKLGKDASSGMTRSLSAGLASGGATVAAAGSALTKGLTVPLVALGVGAAVAATKFSRGMADIATLIPGNSARVKELSDGIKNLSPVVGKSTADLTQGMYQVISAFGDGSDSMQILDTNARAATAGMSTTEEAIKLTSAVTKGYGDTSAEAVGKASDLALMTVRLGQTTFPELAASMGRVTPIAVALGVSQEELFGTMATLTGVTGTAAEVSTQMRAAMQGLLQPTTAASAAIKDAGYASGEALIEQEGFAGALEFLTNAAEEAGVPLGKMISSIEGQTLALALTGEQSDQYVDKLAQMDDALGTTDGAYKEVTEGVGKTAHQFDQFKASVEVLAIEIGDALLPVLGSMVDAAKPMVSIMTDMAGKFESLPGPLKATIGGLLGLAAVMGPAVWITGKLARAAGLMLLGFTKFVKFVPKLMLVTQAYTAVQWLLNAAMVANPIGLIVAGVAALIAAMVVAYFHIEEFRNVVDAAWDGIQEVIAVVLPWIKSYIEFYITAIFTIWKTIIVAIWTVWQVAWDIIQNIITAVMPVIENVIIPTLKKIWDTFRIVWAAVVAVTTAAWDILQSIISFVSALISGKISTVLNAIRTVFQFVWKAIVGSTRDTFNALREIITVVMSFIKDQVVSRFNTIRDIVATVSSAVRNATSQAWNAIKDKISSVVNFVRDRVSSVWNAVSSITSSVWDRVKSIVSGAVDNIKNAIGRLSSIVGTVRDIFNNVTGAIRDKLGGAVDFVRGIPGKIIGAFGDAGTMLYSVGADIVRGLASGIRGAVDAVVEAAKGIASSAINAAKGALGINSPSKVFMVIGTQVNDGLAKGITDSGAGPVRAIQSSLGDMVAAAGSPLGDLGSIGASRSGGIARGATQADIGGETNNNWTVNTASNVPTEESILRAFSRREAILGI
jgi:TP901 family phage tail tape measure protein